MALRFTIRSLLGVTALVAVGAWLIRTSHWLIAIGYLLGCFAAIVAMNVRHLPDARFFRVAVFLAAVFGVVTLVLYIDYMLSVRHVPVL